jgi:hypothetical protein
MPEQRQTVIDEGVKSVDPEKTYGTRVQGNLEACFPDSPIYNNLFTTAERVSTYQTLLDGSVTDTFDTVTGEKVPGGLGLGVNSFNTNFTENGVPDVSSLTEDNSGNKFGKGGGAPTSPYVPPLTSPGVGSVDAADQPPYIGDIPTSGEEFGSGYGATANPSATSAEMEGQKLGSYIKGRSFKNSDIIG